MPTCSPSTWVTTPMSETLLDIRQLKSFYGDFQALHGVSLRLKPGEMLALIGANGAGKSTLLKTICGLVACDRDAIAWKGEPIGGLAANDIVKRGIAMVPEGRRLFPSLTVEENLVLGGAMARPGAWNLDAVYGMFPILRDKRHAPSTSLSGGQQQMVAIGRALMAQPKLLLLDEPSLGLSPLLVQQLFGIIARVHADGVPILLVEQNAAVALAASHHAYIIENGEIRLDGPARDLEQNEEVKAAYLGA